MGGASFINGDASMNTLTLDQHGGHLWPMGREFAARIALAYILTVAFALIDHAERVSCPLDYESLEDAMQAIWHAKATGEKARELFNDTALLRRAAGACPFFVTMAETYVDDLLT